MPLNPITGRASGAARRLATSRLGARAVRGRAPLVVGGLVLALAASTGGAVAGSMITGAQIKNYSIQAEDLATNSVGVRAIQANSVQAWDLTQAARAALKGAVGEAGLNGLPGAAGLDGINGLDGATWLVGLGDPSSQTGVDDDLYLDTTTADVYRKVEGAWVSLTNIKGEQGPAGLNGEAGANGTNGTNGAAGTNGINGAAGTNGTNGADGADGATWLTGSGVPSDASGKNGDLYLRTSDGSVYRKAAGTWGSSIANLTGPSGGAMAYAGLGATPGSIVAVLLGGSALQFPQYQVLNGITSTDATTYTVQQDGAYRISYRITTTNSLLMSTRVVVNGLGVGVLTDSPDTAQREFEGDAVLNLTAGDDIRLDLYGLLGAAVLEDGAGATMTIQQVGVANNS